MAQRSYRKDRMAYWLSEEWSWRPRFDCIRCDAAGLVREGMNNSFSAAAGIRYECRSCGAAWHLRYLPMSECTPTKIAEIGFTRRSP
jgi:hypothetical protein